MVARTRTVAVVGLRAVDVTVEAHAGSGLPGFSVIGSSGSAGREASERVRTALVASGYKLKSRKVLLSLAPADVPKAGARHDLAMAVAALVELGHLPETTATQLAHTALLGELALDGALRAVPGVLPCAASLPARGISRLLVPEANAAEAALVGGLEVVAVANLVEAAAVLSGAAQARARPLAPQGALPFAAPPGPDLADVRGQPEARRALEVAAAGAHHLLLLGPPGCGKSMLARRLPGVLPPLDQGAALEVLSVRSVAGLLGDQADAPVLDHAAPLRAPHHGISAAALLGGGTGVARPGEVSLAHHGVLFLDELLEWSRATLEALRQPLEEGVVRVSRSRATVVYPARFLLVAASNPCPCGGHRCGCSDEVIAAYRGRLSGPLADRVDLAPRLLPLSASDLLSGDAAEPSAAVAARVAAARAVAEARAGALNARARLEPLRRTAAPVALRTLGRAVEAGRLTGRGYDRALRVARTCADLAGAETLGREHVLEALAHRGALTAVRQGAA